MSITHAMPNANKISSYFEKFSYVISGKHDMNRALYTNVGIILLHDPSQDEELIEKSLHNYIALYSHKIIVACANGSMISEAIQSKFSDVFFFTLQESHHVFSVGGLLNILFTEINTDLVFVSWTNIEPYGISTRMLLLSTEEMPLCTVPIFENVNNDTITMSYKPACTWWGLSIHKKKKSSFSYTFFPHNFVGIFNRKKYNDLQGFDSTILDPFWQLCDFAIRSYANEYFMRINPYYRVKQYGDNFITNKSYKNKNYMYHYMCLKYSFGFRIIHTIQCMLRRLFKKNKVMYKKYKKANYDTKYLSTLKQMVKKNIALYW